jgi:hypothetical protein
MRRWALGTAAGAIAVATVASRADADPWAGWKSLRFRARASVLTGSVAMDVSPGPDGALNIETAASASFLGARLAHSRTTTVVDGKSGLPRRHVSVSDKRARRYVFGEAGYTVERLSGKGHAREPLESWDVTSRAEHAYPTEPDGSVQPVFDYYGMLLHLGKLALEKVGDEAVVLVATPRGPVPYRIRVGEATVAEETIHDQRTSAKRTLSVRQLRLRITPADPSAADEGFLKMEGETEVWVEAASKTMIRISGKIPKVPGRVRIVLAEIG